MGRRDDPEGVRQDIPPAQPSRDHILRHQGEVRRGRARKDVCHAEVAARTQMHLPQPRRPDPSTERRATAPRGRCAQTAGCGTKSGSFPCRLLRPEGIPTSSHAPIPQNVHKSEAENPELGGASLRHSFAESAFGRSSSRISRATSAMSSRVRGPSCGLSKMRSIVDGLLPITTIFVPSMHAS